MKKLLAIIFTLSLILAFTSSGLADMGSVSNSNITGGAAIGADNQAQGQGQNQGQSINTVDNSTNNVEGQDRAFPVPGGVGYGPVINYYGKPLPTAQFRPIETLLQYGNIFTEGALESIANKGTDALCELEVVDELVVKAKADPNGQKWIKIIATVEMQEGHQLIGYVTSEADNRKTSMLEVVAKAGLAAIKAGADTLQVVAQGASRDTETSGWGIGFNTTQAFFTGGGQGGADSGANVSSGGTGYSQAWAGMRDKPWIQANALVAPKPVWTGLKQAEPKKK